MQSSGTRNHRHSVERHLRWVKLTAKHAEQPPRAIDWNRLGLLAVTDIVLEAAFDLTTIESVIPRGNEEFVFFPLFGLDSSGAFCEKANSDSRSAVTR